jgi:phosphoglycerate kinase
VHRRDALHSLRPFFPGNVISTSTTSGLRDFFSASAAVSALRKPQDPFGWRTFTFKKVLEGMEIGDSLFDPEGAKIVGELLEKAKAKGVKIHLPVDFICGDKFEADAKSQTVDDKRGIPAGWIGLDVGPKSRELFAEVISRAKTIIWNGPPGVFEFDRFAEGTRSMAQAIAAATAEGALSVLGGGDTATAAKKFKVIDKVSHASTGGGASLELLEGKILPGVANLSDK